MKKKTLVLAVMVSSPAILALATIAVPHIGLFLLGLAFLGVSFAGIVTVIGILLATGGLLRAFPMSAGPAGLADLLLS